MGTRIAYNIFKRLQWQICEVAGESDIRRLINFVLQMENEVRKRLAINFPEAEIAVDFADGKHMSVEIQAKEFTGKNLLEQHRLVNAVLADLFADGSLHALKLKTRIK